jgi:intraflagellar transport protein 46
MADVGRGEGGMIGGMGRGSFDESDEGDMTEVRAAAQRMVQARPAVSNNYDSKKRQQAAPQRMASVPEHGGGDGDDDDDEEEDERPPARAGPGPGHRVPPQQQQAQQGKQQQQAQQQQQQQQQQQHHQQQEDEDEDGEEEEEEDEEDVPVPGQYNPANFAHLNVPAEVKELFSKIERYTPPQVSIPTKLMPFIPDYHAAVGDLDAFISVPRPDGRDGGLGLTVLDEPAIKQSNPAALTLTLRSLNKAVGAKVADPAPEAVGKVDPSGNPKQIAEWIASVEAIHKTKPPDSYVYPKIMPEIESLMQVWPAEIEGLLASLKLPSADLDVSLEEYAKICCAVLDIPVHGNAIIPSLHLLFSLYAEFQASQHFAH